jgi:hypothetical protein
MSDNYATPVKNNSLDLEPPPIVRQWGHSRLNHLIQGRATAVADAISAVVMYASDEELQAVQTFNFDKRIYMYSGFQEPEM